MNTQSSGNEKESANLDPITFSIVWNSLIAIVEEMGTALHQTAFSDAVREGFDFSTALVDVEMRLIAQGTYAPGHLGSIPFAVRAALDAVPVETLRPGDGILLNDSQLNSGHLPDLFLITPIFIGSAIVAYAVNTVHHIDIGGAAPGSMQIQGVTEVYQEGLRIVPVKFIHEGKIDPGLLRILLANTRIPKMVRGDIQAQLAANNIAVERVAQLIQEYGLSTFERVVDGLISTTEKTIRERVREIPDGEYSFTDYIDDYGVGTPPIRICADIRIKGDDIEFDLSRSSDQVALAINMYINYTRSWIVFALRVFTDAVMPQNHGVFNAFRLTVRKGSIFNPQFPAPSAGRSALIVRVFDTINGALSQARPERAMGAFSHTSTPTIGGVDDNGEPFALLDLVAAGYGGQASKDGLEAMSPVVNTANIPIEVHETIYPVIIRKFEFIPDTGGAGKFRGGCGIRKDYEIMTAQATINLIGDRHVYEPYGIFGGQPGKKAITLINPDTDPRAVHSKATMILKRGDVLSVHLSGAGGYGDPGERDRKRVQEDIAEGYVTPDHAMRAYGKI
jgi:N-methylhydantoinase B